ncbi:hypothetical protein D9758_011004 [Tetrapyrgos nigripes]|uniref:Nephrocystin 3-like N-terminal domain-containing protein n=1 Tax=Tetrapyrgos nigripes TaxID=182062 RepID=A0A8H5GHV8_9AGAR|nr:hypothetical protein D9758_011004 [Tetrapyrgos nigripes]
MKQVRKFLHIDKKQNRNPNQPRKTRVPQLGHHSSNATPRTSTADLDHNVQGPLIAPDLLTATRAPVTPPPIAPVSLTTPQPSSAHGDFDTFPTSNSMMSDTNRKGKGDAKGSGTNDYLEYGSKLTIIPDAQVMKTGEDIQSAPANRAGQSITSTPVMERGSAQAFINLMGAQQDAGGDINNTINVNLEFEKALAIERDTSKICKNQALQNLPVASAAAHTSGIYRSDVVRRACTKGTRTKVLEDIQHWLHSENAPPVFWLTGAAGMGKTTIAMTICEELEDLFHSTVTTGSITDSSGGQHPSVSFFASRQLDSGDPQYLLPTICRRLADLSSSYAGQLVAALEGDSRLATAKLDIQFEGMLVKPWQVSSSERTRDLPICIVVIDALDENGNGFIFLKKLLGAVRDSKLEGLRFLVTSRTEPHIAELCSSFEPNAVCRLQDIPVDKAQKDILLYLQEEFSGLREDMLQLIVEQSHGLFIYAATVVKMAAGSTKREQERSVEKLLKATYASTNHLDLLYQQIVKDVLQHDDEDIQHDRFHILHVILCAVHALQADVIAQLTNTDEEDVLFVVGQLHAVMYMAHDGRIQTYHASFADFALQYKCDVGTVHASLVQYCYDIMKKQLHFNICGLESSFIMDKDILDLETCVAANIHPTLQYAIVYWTTHLEKSTPSDTLRNIPRSFVDNLLLFWLEAVNLLNARIDAMRALYLVSDWIAEHDKPSIDIWKDTINFCRAFTSSEMRKSTPHLYVSALSTWNPQSHVSKCWQPCFPNIPKVSGAHSSAISMHIATECAVYCVAISPKGDQIVSGGEDSAVCVWDAASGEQLKELTGHSGPVWSVAFSPKGDQIVSGGEDSSVCVWDAASGQQLKKLTGHSGSVQSVAFSPKGDQIVSGGRDSSVRVWDAASEEQLKELTGHSGLVWSVAFSPKGDQIVSGGDDSSVCVWDAASGEQLKELTGHSGPVSSVAFSPKGDQIVSGGKDLSVHVWDAASGEQLKELRGHSGSVLSVAFAPKGDQIVSGGADSSVHVWDVASGEQLKELTRHSSWVWSVTFSPKGDQIVSGGSDLSVYVWDAASGEQLKELTGHSGSVSSVAFSPKGDQIVSGGEDFSVCVWDAASGEQLKELTGHSGLVWSVAFSPKGDQIVSGGEDSSVLVWDAVSGEQLKELRGHSGSVSSVAFSPKGDQIVSGGSDSSVRVWDAASGEQLKELTGHSGSVLSVAFSPKGDQIVSGWSDSSVCVWDAASGEQLKELTGHSDSVFSVAFSPKGDQIVSGGEDSSVLVWDAGSGEQLKKLTGHSGWVGSVAFSPKGDQIVSGGSALSVCVWDAASGEQLKELTGHSGLVWSVAFSPKGDQIVSGGKDSSVRVWDAASGEQLKEFTGYLGSVYSVAFSPKGDQIVSGGSDSSVPVWDAANGELSGHSDLVQSVEPLPEGNDLSIHASDNRLTSSNPLWCLDSSGWFMLTGTSYHLIWLPTHLRNAVYTPYTKLIISKHHPTQLSFKWNYLGRGWTDLYSPSCV